MKPGARLQAKLELLITRTVWKQHPTPEGVPCIVLSTVCEGARVVICLTHTWREGLRTESEVPGGGDPWGNFSPSVPHGVYTAGTQEWKWYLSNTGVLQAHNSQALLAAHVNRLHPLYLWVQVSWDFQQGPGNIRRDSFSNLRLLHLRCLCGYCGSLCLFFWLSRNSYNSSG